MSVLAFVGCFVLSGFASGVAIFLASALVARRSISLNASGRHDRAMVQLALAMLPASCALGLICPSAVGFIAWVTLFVGAFM